MCVLGYGETGEVPVYGTHSILPKEHGAKFFALPIVRHLTREVGAIATWDSSIHDSVCLNTVTSGSNFALTKKLVQIQFRKKKSFLSFFAPFFFFQFSRVPQKIVLEIWTHIVWKSPTNVSYFSNIWIFAPKLHLWNLIFDAKLKYFSFLLYRILFPFSRFFSSTRKKNPPKFWINFFSVFISEKSWRCIYVYRPFYRQRTTLFDCKGSCSSLGSGGHGSRST